ncbi:MAG: hypothetical protein V4760_15220, partial [Bdellovibrionota bacterium]
MATEHFFRLLGIALLGLIGFVAMPEHHAEPVQVETVQVSQIDFDVQAALEVNQINSGRLKPYMIEEDSIAVSDLDQLEVEM